MTKRFRIVFIHSAALSYYIVERRRWLRWTRYTDTVFKSIDEAAKYIEAQKIVAVVVQEYMLKDNSVISGGNTERIVL
ncbi:MAG: hypothetical protein EBU08_20220 [Micrococcales bacterium]|nr:hypothetical protein [Micrococcales bacterium]